VTIVATVYRPKSGRTCAIGEVGVSSVDPATSRDRFFVCPRFRKRTPLVRRFPTVSLAEDRPIEGAFASGRGVGARVERAATNAEAKIKVRGWTIEIYRSVARVRARTDNIAACRLEILSIPRRPSSLSGSRSRKVTRRTPNDRPTGCAAERTDRPIDEDYRNRKSPRRSIASSM